jgi:hypothetical protein
MKTLTADPYKRVRINSAKPGQVFAVTENADGSIMLTPMKPETKEPFPPGSLRKYFTRQKDEEEAAILKGCVLGPE